MKRHIYDATGTMLIRTEEAQPVCEKDFCDNCGDCLVCYGDEYCYGDFDESETTRNHFWVVYEEDTVA